MKLLKLEILNLASLDRPEGETINFEEGALKESTIFSIVGPTGSGKSTILDAICLALYNRAPRYPRLKGQRNQNIEIYGEPEEGEKNRIAPTDSRNILTRGRKQGYSKLTFLANNGSVYRAEWYVNKKNKNFADAITSLYRISGTAEEAAEWDTLPQIIGLDYEQFLRTVLIAQGSFASFLTAKEEERYQLLEKLVGCGELYAGIAERIRAKRDEAVQAYNEIAAGFTAQQEQIIPDEELEILKTRIAELEEEQKKVKEELQKVNDALGWYAADAAMLQNIDKYTQAFEQAKQKKTEFAPSEKRLALHDATLGAVSIYKEMITAEANIRRHDATLSELGKSVAAGEQQIQQESEALETLQTQAKKAAEEQQSWKPHINKAREIKAQLEALRKTLEEKTAARDEAQTAKTKADGDVAANAKAIETAKADLEKFRQQQSGLQEQIEKQRKSLNDALAAIAGQIETEKKKIEGIDIDKLNADVEALLRTYTLMTSENWAGHRHLLNEGEACPLCGSTHHPYKDRQQLSQDSSELAVNLKLRQKQQKDYNQTNILLGELTTKKDAAAEAITKFDAQVQESTRQAEQKVTEASNRLLGEQAKTETLKAQQAEKASALENAAAALTQAQADVAAKTDAIKAEIGDKDPDAFEKALAEAKDKADEAVTAKVNAIAAIRESVKELKGKETATRTQKDTEAATLQTKTQELTAWLDRYNAGSEEPLSQEAVAQLYAATDNWEALRGQQAALAREFTSAQTTLDNGKLEHLKHQDSKPEQTAEELTERKAGLEAQSGEELVNSKARLQRHEDATRQMGTILERRREAETLKTEWEQIWDAVGTDGKTLRKIAQCYTLRFLIEHANVEIRKFNSRYELQQVKNSLGIRVIDHDRADDVRDTTTLSGGETFIVSLGLALGLSSLSSRNISFSNLFIDEGFGTLDPETLATVIDSLAMLQSSQGKKVGVISHTDTMSERIATQIRIIKNGNSGSSRIEIYP